MAPEMYEEHYDEAVDVYAFGMCMLEMATSEYPYNECSGPAQIYKKVTSGIKPASFDKVENLEVTEIIERCIRLKKEERPNCSELLKFDFFCEVAGITLEPEPLSKEHFLHNHDATKIEFRLRMDPKRKAVKSHKENEAIQFDFDITADDFDEIANEMCKSGLIMEEDSRAVSKLLKVQVHTLLKDRQERQAAAEEKEIAKLEIQKQQIQLQQQQIILQQQQMQLQQQGGDGSGQFNQQNAQTLLQQQNTQQIPNQNQLNSVSPQVMQNQSTMSQQVAHVMTQQQQQQHMLQQQSNMHQQQQQYMLQQQSNMQQQQALLQQQQQQQIIQQQQINTQQQQPQPTHQQQSQLSQQNQQTLLKDMNQQQQQQNVTPNMTQQPIQTLPPQTQQGQQNVTMQNIQTQSPMTMQDQNARSQQSTQTPNQRQGDSGIGLSGPQSNASVGQPKKRRSNKSSERYPKLMVLSLTEEKIVECEMEVKPKTVTFKFDVHEVNPVEVANDLVSCLIEYLRIVQ